MKRSFESLLVRAAEKRAEVRVKPSHDPKTGNLIFIAHLHGEGGTPSKYFVSGSYVMSIPLADADRELRSG